MRIPLFPLNTVLFPGGTLTLRIFEQRYLQMVSECLRQDSPFGVCLIWRGEEVGEAAVPHRVGTLARSVDWEKGKDGLLGIVAHGGRRFRILDFAPNAQQLLYGNVELLPELEQVPLSPQHRPLADLLRRSLELLAPADSGQQLDDANWVSYRLAELLPLPRREKQRLLQCNDPEQRLTLLQRLLQPATDD
ncbi:MAG: peptidase S16 [Xanthomonadaceae bacterium]|nr:peptidase S16 [Xanthomonadaceae bacterium]